MLAPGVAKTWQKQTRSAHQRSGARASAPSDPSDPSDPSAPRVGAPVNLDEYVVRAVRKRGGAPLMFGKDGMLSIER